MTKKEYYNHPAVIYASMQGEIFGYFVARHNNEGAYFCAQFLKAIIDGAARLAGRRIVGTDRRALLALVAEWYDVATGMPFNEAAGYSHTCARHIYNDVVFSQDAAFHCPPSRDGLPSVLTEF